MKLGVQVGLGPGHIVLDGDPASPSPKGAHPQFSAHVRCGQMAGWIKMPLGMKVGFDPGDFVLDGDPPALSPQSSPLPNFWPMSLVTKRLDGSRWHLARRWALVRPHCARWGPTSPTQKRGRSPFPNFRPISIVANFYFYCGQTVGCIKMPLGIEVGLSPGDTMLDGDPVPSPKRGLAEPLNFRPMYCGQTAG